jgi:hypothetical protein
MWDGPRGVTARSPSGAGSGRPVDSPLVDLADDDSQHLAEASGGQLSADGGNRCGLLGPDAGFVELLRDGAKAAEQRLQGEGRGRFSGAADWWPE